MVRAVFECATLCWMPQSSKQSFKSAYDSAENMHASWTVNNENETAGKQDYHQFACRHPQLGLWNAQFTTEAQKLPSEVSDIPQPAGVNSAEDEVNDIHVLSTGRGHDTAEVLKKVLPDRRKRRPTSKKRSSAESGITYLKALSRMCWKTSQPSQKTEKQTVSQRRKMM